MHCWQLPRKKVQMLPIPIGPRSAFYDIGTQMPDAFSLIALWRIGGGSLCERHLQALVQAACTAALGATYCPSAILM